ncbi:MAG: zinc ribbon domain-containing protein [Pseudomonadota bacterium]|nr:zinc ribbon domain-containing protein [Pseudomonadota bacterium]
MPIYEYQCTKCEYCFELMQRMSDSPPSKCPECGNPGVKKLISRVGFQLKGTGWYETDFKNKQKDSTKNKSEGDDKATKTSEEKKKNPATETKTNTDSAG